MRRILLWLLFASMLQPVLTFQAVGGTISGVVTDLSTGAGIGGVTVTANPGNYTTTSNSSNPFEDIGSYTLSDIPAGTYQVSAAKAGYDTKTLANVVVTDGSITTVDLALTPAGAVSKLQVTLSPADGTVNEPVTITAITPESNLYYKLWVTKNSYCTSPSNLGWEVLQDWSTFNSYTWTPTNAGEYILVVWANNTPANPPCPNQLGMTYWVRNTSKGERFKHQIPPR